MDIIISLILMKEISELAKEQFLQQRVKLLLKSKVKVVMDPLLINSRILLQLFQ